MITYSEDWIATLLFSLKGSVAVRACYFAIPAALITLFFSSADDIFYSGFREDVGINQAKPTQLWSASTAVLVVLLGFRTNRAMARFWEGTGLLHQMRGEWFDSISCCVTFSRAASPTKPKEVKDFRHTLVRLMSLCHGCALEEIAESGEELETIDSFGLDNYTLRYLKDCKVLHQFNTVEVLLHMIQTLITKNHDDGVLKIPPPILSRVYQTLSRGFVNLLNAKKIADTRFPFPYAQTITILLFLNVALMPAIISCIVESRIWGPLFTFVPIFGMFSLNFIGVELENPFGNDDNDLPLDHFQTEMNKCLLMLLEEHADLVAGISDARCVKDYGSLVRTMRPGDLLQKTVPRSSMHEIRRLSHFEDYVDMSECRGSEYEYRHDSAIWSKFGGSSTMTSVSKEMMMQCNSSSSEATVEASLTSPLNELNATRESTDAPPDTPKPALESLKARPLIKPKTPKVFEFDPHGLGLVEAHGTLDSSSLDLRDFDNALQELKLLIQTRIVNDFNRMSDAMQVFCQSIPTLPDPMPLCKRSRWQRGLANDLDKKIFKDGLHLLPALRETLPQNKQSSPKKQSTGPSCIRPESPPISRQAPDGRDTQTYESGQTADC